jgi:hypothetical protein
MKPLAITNKIKKIYDIIPKNNIEKLAFKVLLGVWVAVLLVILILKSVYVDRDDIEIRFMGAATETTFPAAKKSDFSEYESLLEEVKYPEEVAHMRGIKRDPFSEFKEELAMQPIITTAHDFVLQSIGRVQLPMVYKGYIELPDSIIGQINWYDSTRFVKPGSLLDGYKIRSVSKQKVEALNKEGEEIEFKLNKPVFGNELQAVLYDNISQKTFTVRVAGVIDDYRVIDISSDYVILLTEEEKIKLKKGVE